MGETTQSSSTSETQNEQDPTTETVTTSESSETQETTNNDLEERFKRMEAALKKANAEAKSHRLESEALKKFKEQIESEKLTDDEKREAARTKLEQQLSEHQSQSNTLLKELQEQRVTNEVYKQASKLNIIDLDAAARLIDSSKIVYDDDHNPTNIDDLLKDMVKQRSWLVGKAPTQTSGGATNPSRSQTSAPTDLTEEYVKSIVSNPDAFNKLSPGEQQRINAWIGKNYVRYR